MLAAVTEGQVRTGTRDCCKTVGSAYVGSNPTPATTKPQVRPSVRTGPDGCPGAVTGPLTVSVGQLWARSGQVRGLRAAGCRSRESPDRTAGTAPVQGSFPQVTVLHSMPVWSRPVPLGPTACSCIRTPGGRDQGG